MRWFRRSWWKAYEAERLLMPYHGNHVPDPHPSCARAQPTLLANPTDIKLGNGLRLNFAPQRTTQQPKEWWPK